MLDHDQRFKVLLQTFPSEFFAAFLPEWHRHFDFDHIDWLATEAFPDPPRGERRSLDLVARLPVRESLAHEPSGTTDDMEATLAASREWLSLIHIEVDGTESVASFRPRMYDYFSYLRWRHRIPVLPVALFLNIGLEGLASTSIGKRSVRWRFCPFSTCMSV